MPTMTRGVPTKRLSSAERSIIQREAVLVRDNVPSKEYAAVLGVSRQAVRKWAEGSTVPKEPQRGLLRTLAAQVASRLAGQVSDGVTKVTPSLQSDLAKRARAGVASSTLRPSTIAAAREYEDMGAVIPLRKARTNWRDVLEVALWYHERDIQAGALTQTTIAMAREGRFVEDGCGDWDPVQWWSALETQDQRNRSEFRIRPATKLDNGEGGDTK